MSGWLVIARLDGGPIDREDLARCMGQLRARGPHGESLVVEGSAALGLTVLDTGETVPTAHEPVRCGRLIVTGHALITARDEVGRALGVSPGELAAMPDLALLARALERWGEEVPARVFGEYAAAAWDAQARRLLVVRDAFGVRPAYFARAGGLVAVSNTLDAVRVHPAVSEHLDEEAMLEFFLFDWIISENRTPFADVRLTPKGGALVAAPEATRTRTAWSLAPPPIDRVTPWREQAHRWRDALDAATADRVRGARASISLSGGIDSTAVAASAALVGPERLYAATDVLGALLRGRDDEGDFAALAARHLGIRHGLFTLPSPPADAPFAWEPMRTPMPDGSVFAVESSGSWTAMRAHAPVLLHGEGGDEIWRASELNHLLGVEPWGALARGIADTLLSGRRPPLGLNVRGRLRGTRRPPRPPPWLAAGLVRRFDVEHLLREGRAQVSPLIRHPRGGSLKGITTALWQGCLTEYDNAGAQHAVELRLPLLDHRVVQAALSLPPYPGAVDKLAARYALAGRLPASLLRRRKTPAAALADHRNRSPPWERLPDPGRLASYVDVAGLQRDVRAHGASWQALRALAIWRWLAGGARRPYPR